MQPTVFYPQQPGSIEKFHSQRAKKQNRQSDPGTRAANKSNKSLNSKIPWHRIQQSHLLVDRQSGDVFAVDTGHLKRLGPTPGVWIPLEKQHPDEPTVEYLSPFKRFKVKAQIIGPVTVKEPVDLTISLDENDENGRFQVIF